MNKNHMQASYKHFKSFNSAFSHTLPSRDWSQQCFNSPKIGPYANFYTINTKSRNLCRMLPKHWLQFLPATHIYVNVI